MIAGQNFVDGDGNTDSCCRNNVCCELDGAEQHAENVIGTIGGILVQLDGHNIVAKNQVVRQHENFCCAFGGWLLGSQRVENNGSGHSQRADSDAVEVINGAVIDV